MAIPRLSLRFLSLWPLASVLFVWSLGPCPGKSADAGRSAAPDINLRTQRKSCHQVLNLPHSADSLCGREQGVHQASIEEQALKLSLHWLQRPNSGIARSPSRRLVSEREGRPHPKLRSAVRIPGELGEATAVSCRGDPHHHQQQQQQQQQLKQQEVEQMIHRYSLRYGSQSHPPPPRVSERGRRSRGRFTDAAGDARLSLAEEKQQQQDRAAALEGKEGLLQQQQQQQQQTEQQQLPPSQNLLHYHHQEQQQQPHNDDPRPQPRVPRGLRRDANPDLPPPASSYESTQAVYDLDCATDTGFTPPPDLRHVMTSLLHERDVVHHLTYDANYWALGVGAYAEVHLGRMVATGECVVVKRFVDSPLKTIEREIRIHRYVESVMVNTPRLLGVLPTGPGLENASLVYQYVAGITLYDFRKNPLVSRLQVFSVALQMALALDTLHRKCVMHNDFHSSNIIITFDAPEPWLTSGRGPVDCGLSRFEKYDDDLEQRMNRALLRVGPLALPRVQLIDFGHTTYRRGKVYLGSAESLMSIPHLAPEVMRNEVTRPASDVFSLGHELEHFARRLNDTVLWRLVRDCLQDDPVARPSIREALDRLRALLLQEFRRVEGRYRRRARAAERRPEEVMVGEVVVDEEEVLAPCPDLLPGAGDRVAADPEEATGQGPGFPPCGQGAVGRMCIDGYSLPGSRKSAPNGVAMHKDNASAVGAKACANGIGAVSRRPNTVPLDFVTEGTTDYDQSVSLLSEKQMNALKSAIAEQLSSRFLERPFKEVAGRAHAALKLEGLQDPGDGRYNQWAGPATGAHCRPEVFERAFKDLELPLFLYHQGDLVFQDVDGAKMLFRESETSSFYTGYFSSSGRELVIKQKQTDDYFRIRFEALVNLYLNHTGWVPAFYGVLPLSRTHLSKLGIVQERFGHGVSLQQVMRAGGPAGGLVQRLRLALRLTSALRDVHATYLLLNNLHADHILCSTSTPAGAPDEEEGGGGGGCPDFRFVDLREASSCDGKVYADTDLGALTFLAPEVRQNQRTSVASDVYSLCFILRELFAPEQGDFHVPAEGRSDLGTVDLSSSAGDESGVVKQQTDHSSSSADNLSDVVKARPRRPSDSRITETRTFLSRWEILCRLCLRGTPDERPSTFQLIHFFSSFSASLQ